MKLPFSSEHLDDPELAIQELGRDIAESIYLSEVEPLYTYTSYYPKDWQWRRYFVKKNAGGKCQVCNDQYLRLGEPLRRYDTHHQNPMGRGQNDHSFGPGGNLIYLCGVCHEEQHL